MNPEAKRSPSEIPETPNNLLLKEALADTIHKANAHRIDLYLTGGTAAAVFAGETRPLSLDLDFFVNPDAKEKIERVFGGKFRYFGEKKLFKSDKMTTLSLNGVDLDFIAEQNIVPDETKPDEKITLCLNTYTRNKACEKNFMEERVQVMPPEFVVVAKLFAGRGKELGKYDLGDSEALIESGIIRTEIFKRAVLEIAGNDQRIRYLVYVRLYEALKKLTPTPRVIAVAQALAQLYGFTGNIEIEHITEATRRQTIPDEEDK